MVHNVEFYSVWPKFGYFGHFIFRKQPFWNIFGLSAHLYTFGSAHPCVGVAQRPTNPLLKLANYRSNHKAIFWQAYCKSNVPMIFILNLEQLRKSEFHCDRRQTVQSERRWICGAICFGYVDVTTQYDVATLGNDFDVSCKTMCSIYHFDRLKLSGMMS